MKFRERLALTARYELRLSIRTAFSPFHCYLSKLALIVGFGALLVPWDPMVTRISLFGYFDEVGFVLSGLACARLLVPNDVAGEVARRCEILGGASPNRTTSAQLTLGRLCAASMSIACIMRRRISRMLLRLRRRRVTSRAAKRDLFDWLGYRSWWRLRAFAAPALPPRGLIVLGGSERSGTTLLRTILGRHPQIASGPETTVFLKRITAPEHLGQRLGWDPARLKAWQRESCSQAEFITRVQAEFLERSGKTIWAEKTPGNVERFGFVRKHFPHAKLVHIVRDGRDVVCSLRQKPFAKIDGKARDSAAAARRCAIIWRQKVVAGLRYRDDPSYYELRYEDLVQTPVPVLRALMNFLELPWDDRLLIPQPGERDPFESKAGNEIFGSSVGRWRRALSVADLRAIHAFVAPTLVDLGYEQDLHWDALVADAGRRPDRLDLYAKRLKSDANT